jgi:hypothetical protein
VNERGGAAPERGVQVETFLERLAADAARRGATEGSA